MKIKKYILYSLAIATMTSCEDFLDVNPEMGITKEEVYGEYYNFRGAMDRATALVHNYVFDRFDWDCEVGGFSDEAQAAQGGVPTTNTVNPGLWLDYKGRDFGFNNQNESSSTSEANRGYNREPAGEAVAAIRAVNQCLANIDLLTVFPEEIGYTPEELKSQLLGQCYFLRGWHYFQIINRYGGMPIMDRVFDNNEDFDVVRPTYLESAEWMISDMDEAIKYLPTEWKNASDKGRPTQASAKALKAMMLLYAASPNMNPDLNPYGSDSKLYNIDMAKRAVEASIEAIKSLEGTRYKMYDKENYFENFYSKTHPISDEALFQPPLTPSTAINQWAGSGTGWYLPFFDGGWTVFNSPTQNAVDWFETSTGWDVNDSRGDFNPDDPYSNRDPRLKMFIYCHGDDMYPLKTQTDANHPKKLDASEGSWHWNQFKNKGLTFTGYIHHKHRWNGNNNLENVTKYYRIFPFIRVAQLYLDFAEAANEVYGPTGAVPNTDLTAVEAINIVRRRVGMCDVRPEYTTDKETFRKRIYNERAVELYQEFHRWTDIRRWRIAKDLFKDVNCIYGAYIHSVNGELKYEKRLLDVAVRVFEDKHYWYPFDIATMNMMSVFKQNPGW